MNLPPQLQKEVEKWAKLQGVSSEQFILQTVAEKIALLNQQIDELSPAQPNVYYKGGVLVVDGKPIGDLDINAFIYELREERIREQMNW